MANKIFGKLVGAASSILGVVGGKKTAAPASPVAAKSGPIVTKLGAAADKGPVVKSLVGRAVPSILRDTLGGN